MGSSHVSIHAFAQRQIISCAKSSARGAELAQLELLRAYEPLFCAVIRDAKKSGILRTENQLKDAEQAARLGFLEALVRYDADRGFTLGVFARPYVTGAVYRVLAGDARYWMNAETLPAEDIHSENGPVRKIDPALMVQPDTSVEDQEIADMLGDFVNSLPSRQRYIVWQVYWNDRPQADVARELGVSRMAVNGLLKRVTAQGRHVLNHVHLN